LVWPVEVASDTNFNNIMYKQEKTARAANNKRKSKMTSMKIVMATVALVGLSACDSNSSLGGLGGDRNGSSSNGSGTGTGISQSSLDPASIAYFNQEIGDTVLFLVDQSTLTPTATALLDRQAAWLLSNPQNSVTIEGHADEQGTREYNLALGARRAASVQNYLISRGLTDARVRTVTFGKERPLAVCSDEACWAKNRRSVTLVAGGLGS
jgi:peptidoglycan-associated lipoprotein